MDITDYDQIKITPSINYMDPIDEGEEEKRPILQELLIHNCNCAARLLLNDDWWTDSNKSAPSMQ